MVKPQAYLALLFEILKVKPFHLNILTVQVAVKTHTVVMVNVMGMKIMLPVQKIAKPVETGMAMPVLWLLIPFI